MRPPFLERINIVSFGAFSGKVVGPFTPNLNVVFGRNEAGKTTLASFVGGVLFGWEDARGSRNTYKPTNAERAGSLFFAVPRAEYRADENRGTRSGRDAGENCGAHDRGDAGENRIVRERYGAGAIPDAAEPVGMGEQRGASEGGGNEVLGEFGEADEIELTRVRNVDGLQGDTTLVADIDKETFQTMFALTSDELRSLRNTTDMTAKLLTAGSGTGASPAHALAKIDELLAGYTSRSAGAVRSLVRLEAEQDELRARLAVAFEEAERFKREDKEFRDLAPQRDEMMARLDALNTDIEALSAHRAQVKKLNDEIAEARERVAALVAEEEQLAITRRDQHDDDLVPLMHLAAGDERALRDRLDALASEEAKCEHAVDLAQDNFATSKAAFEALLEAEDAEDAEGRARQRHVQVALSILLPLVFMVAGVPLFIHGREIASLSFTALGVGLVVFAVVVTLAALVMLFRPDKAADAKEARKQDAHWIMLQDKKKLEACLQNRAAFQERARTQLDAAGLGPALGSLRQSRALLDEAREARAEERLFRQRQQALVSRRIALEDSLDKAERQRDDLFEHMLPHGERTLDAIDALLAQKARQRSGLLEASEALNRRYGELKQELAQAVHLRDFDELKLRYEQACTQQEEYAREYARLLLAKRMLESAIAAWESKSQPEVYRQASRLLALMTDGRWAKVSMTEEGRLRVIDAVKNAHDPLHLSLGTCQQLYLALRIALLMTADNVGRSVPILADDILVNFDSVRRAGAAQAIAELARVRQVVLLTCHEEIVEALREADPTLNEVRL
ncbi:AAA family ATPase [Enteroscipio rubneri]|uniref:Sugar ABC transporter ATP-binding protein n=1 Tax=Enteroscipio rubneri TaxID=2070686 RepID=A0A2K2U9B0_9ACTN|nr:AAA family ATPase [Enteroscipio rubneri]PNV66849.1 sugar ABC transporter ATP-binding protein [Enteroscipio rubneri]